jgi:hypothetical protein
LSIEHILWTILQDHSRVYGLALRQFWSGW